SDSEDTDVLRAPEIIGTSQGTRHRPRLAMKDEIEHLLPWHAVDALSRSEARRVEESLAKDPELARRFEMVRDEFGENVLLNESLGAPSGQAAARLFAKIKAEPARRKPLSLQISA